MQFRLLLIITIISILGCSQNDKPDVKAIKRVPVRLAPVRLIDHTIGIEASGVLEPSDMIRLSFKTGGIISEIHVEEGQAVKKGQELARLDVTEIDQRLAQSGTGKTQATINIERAEIALAKAKRDLESATALLRDSVIIEDDFKNAETAFNLAEREWNLANKALEMAESNQKIAQFNAGHSVIYAPHNGKILKRLAEPTELTGPGMPVFIFTSGHNKLSLIAGLAESDVVKIREGDKAKVRFFAHPDTDFEGVVEDIAPLINPESATFDVKIRVDAKNKKLLSGFIGNVEIFPENHQSFFTIPAQALVDANGKTGFVFIIDKDNFARRVPVSIIGIYENDVILDSKTELSDSVVTIGVEYLFSGTKVISIKE